MIKVTVQKNLIGLEDLLVGVGTVLQTRGPTGAAPVTITRINGANFPYDDDFSMSEKIDDLQSQIDTLPEVVDGDGNMLTGLINTSATDLNLAGRLWRKTISSTEARLYYGTQLMFKYNPTSGDIILPDDTDYIAADEALSVALTTAFEAADEVLADAITALSDSLGSAAELDAGTGANDLVQLNADAKLPAVDGSLLTNLPQQLPIGAIIQVPYSTVDTNFLKCNGQVVSRTTYAALFAKLGTSFGVGDGSTTFALPDLRGEFVRGWDDARDIDTGRVIGSAQTDSLKSHLHASGTLAASTTGAHTHPLSGATGSTSNGPLGFNAAGSSPTPLGATDSAGSHTHTISGSTASTGDPETRPRNIALMYIIRAL